MNVIILTEGGKDIGAGHITRCSSIYQAFEEVGIKSQLIVNGDETIKDLLKDKNCKVFDWLNDRRTLFATIRNADIAFIDSYIADYDLYEEISDAVKTAVYFDDDIRIEYPKGIVLNGAVSAEQMPYPKKKGVTYLLGSKYAPLRKEFWDVPAKPILDSIESVMITFGGTDTRNLTPKILKLLVDSYAALTKKVVIARGFQNITEIEEAKDDNTKLIYYPDATQMKRVMFESDIAITAGGQTLYELARTGTPGIGICVAENQLRNISSWSNLGFVEYIGWYNCGNLEKELRSSLEYLSNKRVRMEMSETGKKTIDNRGCQRIVDSVTTSAVVNKKSKGL